MLESGYHQHALVIAKNILGAVAVMDIEVRDGHALQSIMFQRMRCSDRHVIEETETHGTTAFGVVPGRTHAAKRGLRLAFHDHVGCQHRGTRRAQCCLQRIRTHCGVRVEMYHSLMRRPAFYRLDIACGMHAFQVFVLNQRRCGMQQEITQSRSNQLVVDRPQPRRRLGVHGSHVVQQTIRVCDESDSQIGSRTIGMK